MTQPAMDPLAALLYQIAQSEPQPWYPKVFTETRGVPRDSLDGPLERMRLLGLIELTEWVQNSGQGYRLTTAGKQVLYNPRLMAQLQSGNLAPTRPEPTGSPEGSWGNRDATPLERGETIRSGLLSKSRPIITYILMAINVGVFLVGLGLVFPNQKAMSSVLMGNNIRIPVLTGALTPYGLVHGEWWRLLTSCFVHFGIIHLGVNMYSLWVLGPLSERAWGRWRFLALYMIAGLGGSCAMAFSMVTGWELPAAGAGASGALWGLMTGFGVWVFLNRSSLGSNLSATWLRSIGFIVLLNVFITFSISIISKSGHFGGGLFGAAAALLLNEQRFAGGVKRWLATLAAAALPVGALAVVVLAPKGHIVMPPSGNNLFFEELNEYAGASDKASERFQKEVFPVLKKPWKERDDAERAKAEAVLKELREELSASGAAIQRLGPWTNTMEQARTTLLEYVREQKVLYEMASRMLEKGEGWTAHDSEEFRQQQQSLKDIEGRYLELVKHLGE